MLVLGAASGALFAGVVNHLMPAADFAGGLCDRRDGRVVFRLRSRASDRHRAGGRDDRPSGLTLGLLGASLVAMLVAMLLQSEPIYESLKRRMLSQTTVTPRRVDAGTQRPR